MGDPESRRQYLSFVLFQAQTALQEAALKQAEAIFPQAPDAEHLFLEQLTEEHLGDMLLPGLKAYFLGAAEFMRIKELEQRTLQELITVYDAHLGIMPGLPFHPQQNPSMHSLYTGLSQIPDVNVGKVIEYLFVSHRSAVDRGVARLIQ